MPRSRMEDVASLAGVSVTTVSHVVNETRPVAEKTRRRVLDAIRRLDYYQNVHARRLVRGRSDFFGLIISDIENPFFPELIKSFETAALAEGFDTLLCMTNYDPDRARAAFRKMIENEVPGVAVMTSHIDLALAEELTGRRLPTVFLEAGPPQPFRSNIRVDGRKGINQAVRYLYNLGHRDFTLIVGPQTRASAIASCNGIIEALGEIGLSPISIIEGNNRVDGATAAVRTLLTQSRLPSAILAGNDLTAIGAMRALQDAGLRIPEDISIIGGDDNFFAPLTNPPMTTIKVPRDRLGIIAVEALLKLLDADQSLGGEYVVETELIIRNSAGPARRRENAEGAEVKTRKSRKRSVLFP